MSRTVDYHLSLISPYTYLGQERFMALAEKAGAEVNYKPTNLGRVFPASGGLPLAKRAPQRRAYRMMELKRWRSLLEIPLILEPAHFPVPEARAAGVVAAATLEGRDPAPLVAGFLRAVWAEERDISDEETIGAILGENGFDAASLLEAGQSPEVQAALEGYTDEALEAGVFGVPTWIYRGELFWGQDRLDFLSWALAGGGK